MPKKTLKQSKKQRRRTLRRIPRKGKKGGADTQSLTIPTTAFKNATPVNSDSVMGKIA